MRTGKIKMTKFLILKSLFCVAHSIFLFCVVFFLISCSKSPSPVIVTTNFISYDAVRAVLGGDNKSLDSVALLIKPGVEVHNYDPAPSDIMAVENCQLFIYIGGESDEWARKIISSSDKKFSVLRLIDYVDPLCEDDSSEGDYNWDEHIWLDPNNEIAIIRAVAAAVKKIYPVVDMNASDYIKKIGDLDSRLSSVAKGLTHPIIVADRFPFIYLTSRYGIRYIAAFSGCASTTDVTPGTVIKIERAIKAESVNCIYHIELSNKKLALILKDEYSLTLRMLHSMQNVTKEEFDNGETYLTLMEKNILALSLAI